MCDTLFQGKVDCYPPRHFLEGKKRPTDVDIELQERKKYEKEKLKFIDYLRNKVSYKFWFCDFATLVVRNWDVFVVIEGVPITYVNL